MSKEDSQRSSKCYRRSHRHLHQACGSPNVNRGHQRCGYFTTRSESSVGTHRKHGRCKQSSGRRTQSLLRHRICHAWLRLRSDLHRCLQADGSGLPMEWTYHSLKRPWQLGRSFPESMAGPCWSRTWWVPVWIPLKTLGRVHVLRKGSLSLNSDVVFALTLKYYINLYFRMLI